MPYSSTDELPQEVQDKYGSEGQRAFLAAFNSTMEACDGDDCESRAFGAGHSAAQRAEEKKTVEFSPLIEAENSVWVRLKRLIGKTKHVCGFKMIDDNRWVAWYSNAFGPDKDDEFISTKALESDVQRMNRTGDYPELWFFHMKGSKHGKADAVGTVGRFAVATGTFDDTPIAQVFKAFYKSHEGTIAMSFGFDYEPARKINGVYHDVRAFEVSTVTPARFAANPFTVFDTYGIKNMEPQLESLKAVFAEHPELLAQIVSETEESSKILEQTHGYKALIDVLQPVKAEMEVEVEAPTTMQRDEVVELIDGRFKMFEENLKGMFSEYVAEMEKRFSKPEVEEVKSVHDPLKLKMVQDMETELQSEKREIKATEMDPNAMIAMIQMGKSSFEKAFNVKVVE